MNPAVYVQTNDATDNEVVAFKRSEDGSLSPLGRYSTGGRGTGAPHLPSQNSIVLDDDGRWLLVVNAGSDELSLFAVKPDGLELADRVASGGSTPTSVAISGTLAYVLNNATPNLAGFRIDDGRLVVLEGSARALSADDADPAQLAFSRDGRTLAVTERGTDSISAYADRRARLRRRADDDQLVRQDAVRLRLHRGRDDDRHRGVRRRGRRCGGVFLCAHRPRQARLGERLGRRYPQRGVLGGRHERRALRLRHQLRRRDDLELCDRRRRLPRPTRCRGGVDAPGREGRARRSDHPRRALPLRDRRRRAEGLRLDGAAATAN